jgi:hypothetical protein
MEESLNRNSIQFSSTTVIAGGSGAKGTAGMQEPAAPALPPSGSWRDPYRGVILFLLVAALVGTAAAIVAGVMTSNAVLFEVAITLGLETSRSRYARWPSGRFARRSKVPGKTELLSAGSRVAGTTC